MKYFAVMCDPNGRQLDVLKIPRKEKKFNYGNGTYNIKIKEASYIQRKNWRGKKRRYFIYNTSYSDPFTFDKKQQPLINPEDYATLIESEQLKKLNDVNKKGLEGILNAKTIITAVVVLIGTYLVFSGGLV